MKNIKTIVFIFLLMFAVSLSGYYYGKFSILKSVVAFGAYNRVARMDFDLIEKYGQSPYYETIDQIKVSVEKILREKYFITYSWITGNQSYFGIVLIIEHMEQLPLKKEGFQAIWLEDDLGNKYEPLPYYKLINFPEDQPLLWKQVFFGKFEPLNKKAQLITVYFRYNKNLYKIKQVNLE